MIDNMHGLKLIIQNQNYGSLAELNGTSYWINWGGLVTYKAL